MSLCSSGIRHSVTANRMKTSCTPSWQSKNLQNATNVKRGVAIVVYEKHSEEGWRLVKAVRYKSVGPGIDSKR